MRGERVRVFERVHACHTGWASRNAGDNPDGADTACTTCAADYYVSSKPCTACATGLFRLAGDDRVTPGTDTACTYASPFASKAELVNTIASSYCLGGDATGATCTDGKGVAIASWVVSSVDDMAGLFQGSATFNGNIGSWDGSAVTDMSNMFNGATAFNQDISSWVTSSVTDMSAMFQGAILFNAAIPKSGSQWDTAQVKYFDNMFYGATNFNQDISSWVVSSGRKLRFHVRRCDSFNKGFAMTTSWTGAGGATATNMFHGATAWLARYNPPTAGSVDGPASAWSVKPCAANEYVSSNACTPCTTRDASRNAGDNPDGADTACTTCAADYYVSSNAVHGVRNRSVPPRG